MALRRERPGEAAACNPATQSSPVGNMLLTYFGRSNFVASNGSFSSCGPAAAGLAPPCGRSTGGLAPPPGRACGGPTAAMAAL